MSCAHCEKAVKDALLELSEVKEVEVDLANKRVVVEGEALVDEKLVDAIEEAGYDVKEIN